MGDEVEKTAFEDAMDANEPANSVLDYSEQADTTLDRIAIDFAEADQERITRVQVALNKHNPDYAVTETFDDAMRAEIVKWYEDRGVPMGLGRENIGETGGKLSEWAYRLLIL